MSYYYPYNPARKVKGGIKAQSKRGQLGQSWWAKRWFEVLYSFNLGARLDRGKTYARKGQVINVQIEKGNITANVQGSFQEPYHIEIKLRLITKAGWEQIAQDLVARPVFAAKLLASQMPDKIEDIFEGAGQSLFPGKNDLETDCTCPDWANPCKHIAAVYILMGEEFDRDPFLIFKIRGIERQELLAMVGLESAPSESGRDEKLESPPDPIAPDPDEFWGRSQGEQNTQEPAEAPAIPAALPKKLGSFPFWRGEEGFIPALEDIYGNASGTGLGIFIDDDADREGEGRKKVRPRRRRDPADT